MTDLAKLLASSTSGEDVSRIAGDPHPKVVPYEQIEKFDSIEGLLGVEQAVVILYQTGDHYGHWCAIFKAGPPDDKVLEFFDSYGLFVDDELEFTDKAFRREHAQDYPYLADLLLKYLGEGKKAEFNDRKYQKRGRDIATCGRHVGTRLRFRDLTLDEYEELIDRMMAAYNYPGGKDFADVIVTLLSLGLAPETLPQ
jgi:hypothetical protein